MLSAQARKYGLSCSFDSVCSGIAALKQLFPRDSESESEGEKRSDEVQSCCSEKGSGADEGQSKREDREFVETYVQQLEKEAGERKRNKPPRNKPNKKKPKKRTP